MLVKKLQDHTIVNSDTCGELREILQQEDYPFVNVAVLKDVQPTVGHYHRQADEIYFVLEGEIGVRFHDPSNNQTWDDQFKADELCVIRKGIHHKIISVSDTNKLCALCIPFFDPKDEVHSEILLSS